MDTQTEFMEQTYTLSPSTPGAARRFVRSALGDAEDAIPSAELVVSELVTNVIRHAGDTDEITVRVRPRRPIRLEVVQHGIVTDPPADAAPGRRSWPLPNQLSGRGLGIVDAISTDWGYERRGDDVAAWSVLAASA